MDGKTICEDELANQEFAEEGILLIKGNRRRIPTLGSR